MDSEQKDIVFYDDSIQVTLNKETIWLTQKQMAELFDKDTDTIGLHLKNIYNTKELSKNSTTEKYSVVHQEGKREVKRTIQHYNLDAIISIGYRVNSKKGTQFRIWATKVLKEHLVKGYTENKHRLTQLKKIIRLPMAINELRLGYLFGTSAKIIFFIILMEVKK